MKRNKFSGFTILLLLLFVCFGSYGQLPGFNLAITTSPQTCLGNGSMAFTVSGTQSGSAIAYQIYLLPNTTVPVATVNTPLASNLVAGNYLVIATQTLGSQSSSATAAAAIANNVVPLAYTLTAMPAKCTNDGQITVHVTSGTAVLYEIVSGPVTVPQQTSNVFPGLPGGQYNIRVFDNCGDAVVVGIEVGQLQTDISVGNIIDQLVYPSIATCTTVWVCNTYSVSGSKVFFWPLTMQYTVYPPGGGVPTVITTTVNEPPDTGDNSYNAIAEIPFYYDQTYSYDLKITDACGNVFAENANMIHGEQDWTILPGFDPCDTDHFKLLMLEYIAFPVTVTFLSAPAGFNPVEYNPSHPVFNSAEISYHTPGEILPSGNYTIQITDACGRSSIKQAMSGPNDSIDAYAEGQNCNTGKIRVLMFSKAAVVIEFTAAPVAYQEPLPKDLSAFVDEIGDYNIPELPPGNYSLHVIDECGYEHFFDLTVTVSAVNPPTAFQLPGCSQGEGSIRISGGSVEVLNVYIEAAPAEFAETLPFDASVNIDQTHIFNMNSLPPGQYTFTVVTECGPNTLQVLVRGYNVTKNNITVVPNCGYFDLDVKHTSNAGNLQNYWLQLYNEAQNTWEHPLTGLDYTEGTPITNAYAIALTNNSVTTGFGITGKFRVVKVFFTYTNGLVQLTRCTDVISEFVFDGQPEIINAYSFPCADGTADVAIEAIGPPPLNYGIVAKNGEPFTVNNGNSPLFTALESAVYNFLVSDTCGNLRNITYDITELDPLAIVQEGFCIGEDSRLYVPGFSFLIYKWWKEGDPGTVLSTTSTLDFPDYDPAAAAETYYVSITTANPGSCIDIIRTHEVDNDGLPNAGDDAVATICNDGSQLNLAQYLSGFFEEGGNWTDTDATGALSGSDVALGALQQGTYHFMYTVTNSCGLSDQAEVELTLEPTPLPTVIEPLAPVCEGSTIQLSTLVNGAVYEWTGPDGFTSAEQHPLIQNAGEEAEGIYSLRTIAPGSNCFSLPSVIWVEVNQVPEFTVQGNTGACEGQIVELAVVPVNFSPAAVTYQWYFNDSLLTETSSLISNPQPGAYEVVVSNDGCSTSRETDVAQVGNPFELLLDSGCINYDYMLWVSNLDDMPGAVVTWTGPDNFSFTGNPVNISNLPEGEYSATVINAENCTAGATLGIDNTSCIIPRGISPNGDGYNDSFDLSNLDVIELKIFNRYGLKVYEAHNYLNEWHGQSDKGTLPTATYYYAMTLSAGKQITGWVYLQREEK